MNLPQFYARSVFSAIQNGIAPKAALDRLRKILERRGHSRLLESTLLALRTLSEKEEKKREVHVITAEGRAVKKELNAHKEDLPENPVLLMKESPAIIGGYIIQSATKRIDASHRTVLAKLYEKMIS